MNDELAPAGRERKVAPAAADAEDSSPAPARPPITSVLFRQVGTLAGEEIPGLEGFKYNIGYRHQTGTESDAGDENGFVIGLAKDTEIGNGVTLGLIGELAYFEHYTGAADDATYVTVGSSLKRGPWHGELTGSFRDFETNDRLVAASVGYEFDGGYDLSVGYGREHVAGDNNDMIGVRLTKCFSFSTRSKKPEC